MFSVRVFERSDLARDGRFRRRVVRLQRERLLVRRRAKCIQQLLVCIHPKRRTPPIHELAKVKHAVPVGVKLLQKGLRHAHAREPIWSGGGTQRATRALLLTR